MLKKQFLIALLCTLSFSQLFAKGEVKISGKVENAPYSTLKLQIIENLACQIKKERILQLSEQGTFETSFVLEKPTEVWLRYGESEKKIGLKLFLQPENELHIEVKDGEKLLETIQFSGNAAIEQTYFLETRRQFGNRLMERFYEQSYKDAQEVKDQILKDEAEELAYLKAYSKKYKTNEVFEQYAEADIVYGKKNHLLIARAAATNAKGKLIHFPKDFYDFLTDTDFNNETATNNYKYLIAVRNYIGRLSDGGISFRSLEKLSKIRFEQEIAVAKEHLSGKTLDSWYAKFLYNRLTINDLEFVMPFCEDYYSIAISEENKRTIQEKIAAIKSLKGKVNFSKTVKAEFASTQTGEKVSFGEIVEKYKGKVVYVDFWASWCQPCIKAMEQAKKIKEAYKKEEVVFLYLVDSGHDSETTWKKAITRFGIEGEHFLLSEELGDNMNLIFSMRGIPHYALIDRNGTIASFDAPRPSQKKELKKELDKLLKQEAN